MLSKRDPSSQKRVLLSDPLSAVSVEYLDPLSKMVADVSLKEKVGHFKRLKRMVACLIMFGYIVERTDSFERGQVQL